MKKLSNENVARPAVFLDRDGTLIEDKHYLHDPEEIVWMPGAFEALKDLQELGYVLVVITNQSGIGRGYFTEAAAHAVHERLTADLQKEGITLDGIYMCPHAPGEGCGCRKPGTKLIYAAKRDHSIDLGKSWFVGDKAIDIEAGAECGMRTILVGTTKMGNVTPTYAVEGIADAARTICSR